MNEKQQTTASTANREILSTRLIDSPRAFVWGAFSEPEQLAQWWGPRGFRNTFHEFDFHPGGSWRLTMHGPDGTDYKNESIFVEVVEPERVVFRHLDPLHDFQMTITLVDEAENTRLTWRMLFESANHCEKVRPFVVEANEQNFDRLEAQLAKMHGQ